MSPHFMPSRIAPHVPTLIKVSAPISASSSIAIAVEGPPIPVEHALKETPP